MDELQEKEKRVRTLMEEKGLDALLMERTSNFAWYTAGGASFVNSAAEKGVGSLLIAPEKKYVITNNIEALRLGGEEKLAAQGWEFAVGNWWEPQQAVVQFTEGMRLGVDGPYPGAVDVGADLQAWRSRLLPQEVERFRLVAEACGQAIQTAAQRISPGMTEFQIAGLLAEETLDRGCTPIVNLIAADERIFNYRHPIPTDKTLEEYVMLVLCGRRWGLVASATRFVHFGPLPPKLREKQWATATVDATLIAATRPGAIVADIFQQAVDAYAEQGFPGEWHLHHQGGLTGYEPREYVGTPTSEEIVYENQVFAWNPSITGTKSEDTVLVGKETNEILSSVGDWPMLPVEIEGQTIERPAILEA